MFRNIMHISNAKTKRISSYDVTGRNSDSWRIKPGETRVIADIKGPAIINHIWMTQGEHYRDVLIRITWDDAPKPSVICPLGDFFGLGHSIVNSYQSLFFTASTNANNQFEKGCALNCYIPMPFRKHAVIELINEAKTEHNQYFYVNYETFDTEEDFKKEVGTNFGYFHAEFHRENPFGGWGHEITVNSQEADIVNKEKLAWDNNYVILETKGKGHYIGCNYSVTNFQGTWWGEGDDMMWIDGYKWPPDLHGTGSEDFLNQAWGMQPNAFLRNGSSIYENNTGGYQSSYIFYPENPVRFQKEIKVTIEFGHGNHLRNELASVAYWYCETPTAIKNPPPRDKRQPVKKIDGKWVMEKSNQITSREVPLNDEMKIMKSRVEQRNFSGYYYQFGPLGLDEEGQLSIKAKISRDNPNLYDITLDEIMEDIIGKNVVIELIPKSAISTSNRMQPDVNKLVGLPKPNEVILGSLSLGKTGELLVSKVSTKVDLKERLKPLIGKQMEFEVLKRTKDHIKERGFKEAEIVVQIRYD